MLHRTLLKIGLLPPLLNILLVALGLLLMRRYRKLGTAICLLGIVSLYILATPIAANRLLSALEISPALTAEQLADLVDKERTAIVVLGAGHREWHSEYGQPWPDGNGIARLNYAADLHRRTQLPILISGGQPGDSDYVTARVMAGYLSRMHFIRGSWLEEQSRTTEENALYSAAQLEEQQINSIVLVTQSLHMRRAVMLFEQTGLSIIPAPTGLAERQPGGLYGWLPSGRALHQSQMVLHEMLGYGWYKLQGY